MNELNDTFPADFDDLSKYAPALLALRGKAEGFVVPENYFEEFETFLPARIAVEEMRGGEFTVPENYFNDNEEQIPASTSLLDLKAEAEAFGLPENYFEEFPDQVMAQVALVDLKGKTDFTVPENYFEQLPDQLESILNLDGLKTQTGFELPENYFEEFDAELPAKLALDNLRQEEGFVVPENYFEQFSNALLTRVSLESVQEGADADAPEGYFASLADRIQARIDEEETVVAQPEKGRVISLEERSSFSGRKLAVAAAVALFVGLGGWFLYQQAQSSKVQPQPMVADKNQIKPKAPQPVIVPNQPVQNDSVAQNQVVVQPQSQPKLVAQIAPHKKSKRTEKLGDPSRAEVIDNIDLIEENLVAEVASDQISNEKNDRDLNESIQNYLLNDATELGDIIQDIRKP